MKVKTAILQLTSTSDIDHNLACIDAQLSEAAKQGVQLICLPENALWFGEESDRRRGVDEVESKSEQFFTEKAAALEVYILAGSIAVKAGDKTFNRSVLFQPDGERIHYDKIHLFDAALSDREYKESEGSEAGKHVVLADTAIGKIGLSVCYDLRFPELYRSLSEQGAQILTVPSAFTVPTGEAHWESLLRARAIENLCYVIAPAQCGENYPGRETYGHSMIISPWGEVLCELGEEPGVGYAEIDLAYLKECREKLPCLDHRQL